STFEDLNIAKGRKKLQIWIANSEQLSKWVAYQHRSTEARKYGLSQVVEKLASGLLALDSAISAVERTYFEALLKNMAKEDPDLVRFDGELHSRHVRGFAELDLQRIKAAS